MKRFITSWRHFLSIAILVIINSSYQFAQDTRDSSITITISAVGDLMCHSAQYNYARVDGDSFDFNPVYREVKQYL